MKMCEDWKLKPSRWFAQGRKADNLKYQGTEINSRGATCYLQDSICHFSFFSYLFA